VKTIRDRGNNAAAEHWSSPCNPGGVSPSMPQESPCITGSLLTVQETTTYRYGDVDSVSPMIDRWSLLLESIDPVLEPFRRPNQARPLRDYSLGPQVEWQAKWGETRVETKRLLGSAKLTGAYKAQIIR
jgi:hypothetical protein